MHGLFSALGGRKMTNGYLAVVLFTAVAIYRDVGFIEYAGAVLLALGITNATVAAEDAAKAKAQQNIEQVSVEIGEHAEKIDVAMQQEEK